MCGITGYIDFNKNSSQQEIENMTHVLTHRGPDAYGVESFDLERFQMGLGHRRLSIIDLSQAGKQPMSYKDYWVCFNGEVYNYNEIKKELIDLGHQFESTSDTEVVLHAYDQWGRDCLGKFIGMFAFIIINTKTNKLFCARDRAGVKPFFYYLKDGLFLFSSELKSFHEHKGFHKTLNPSSVAAFMQYGNVPGSHCIFNNCYKLKPGHYLELTLNDQNDLNQILPKDQNEYWNVYDYYNKSKLNLSFEEAKKKTEEILIDACNYRMVADVPVGVFFKWGL